MKIYLNVIVVLILLTSCNKIMMKVVGMKTPDFIPVEKVVEYANKKQLDIKEFYVLRDLNCAQAFFSKEMGLAVKMPNINYYNNLGQLLVIENDSTSCTQVQMSYASYPDSANFKVLNETNYLSALKGCLIKYENGQFKEADFPEKDIYIVAFWSTWGGRLSDRISDLVPSITVHENSDRIGVLLFNVDLLEEWPKPQKEQVMAE